MKWILIIGRTKKQMRDPQSFDIVEELKKPYNVGIKPELTVSENSYFIDMFCQWKRTNVHYQVHLVTDENEV